MADTGWSLSEDVRPDARELLELYAVVGWTAYTSDPDGLVRAVAGSSWRVVARSDTGEFIGLARAISDDASICYLQDLLVHPDRQRSGVGRSLVEAVLRRYAHVRQRVLLTDDEPGQRAFYESMGFTEIRDFGEGTLRAFVRIGTVG